MPEEGLVRLRDAKVGTAYQARAKRVYHLG